MKLSLRTMVTFAALGLTAAVTGGTAGASPDAEARPNVERDEVAKAPHGIVQMIGEALAEITLHGDQQATIDGLGAIVVPLQLQVDQAESDLLSTLAEQVRAGGIDREAIDAKVEAYVSAREAFRGPFATALSSLHDLLDADQRDDFADALSCRVHDAVRTETSRERLAEFEDAIGLDAAQEEQLVGDLKELLPAIRAERHHVHRAIEGFRGDSFSIDDYFPAVDVAARARRRAERIINVTDEILGILDADQAKKLAARIEAAAAARSETTVPQPSVPLPRPGVEQVGATQDHVWAVGRRGPWGRRGVVVGGSGMWFGRRVGAFPVAAGWGVGW